MTLPTLNDVQAVEPILTNMLVGYQQADDRFVASRVFPSVPVPNDSGTYWVATKKYFFHNDLERRAPGGSFAELGYGLETGTYVTEQWAGEYAVPDEVRANSQVPLDLFQIGLRKVATSSMIKKEVEFATDFMTTGVWGTDNTTATDWDDIASGDPVDNVLTAVRTISNNTGVQANTMVLGYIVHQALVNHPDIIDRLKHTQGATLAAIEAALASVLGVGNYLVGKAVYSNTNESAAFVSTQIIDDDCLVCHVDPSAGIFGATAGKTFVWAGGGGAGTIYRDPARRNHSEVFQYKMQWDQKAVATDLGYFFSDIV
jgi:hypothetical protein